MFTGIVEEVGTVVSIPPAGRAGSLTIGASKVLEDVALGDSTAVNGVCLTVVDPDGGTVWFANVPRPAVTPAERAATSAEQWQAGLVELFAGDAGPASDGPASSIVDLTGERPRLLREGAIPAGELERVLEEPFDYGT